MAEAFRAGRFPGAARRPCKGSGLDCGEERVEELRARLSDLYESARTSSRAVNRSSSSMPISTLTRHAWPGPRRSSDRSVRRGQRAPDTAHARCPGHAVEAESARTSRTRTSGCSTGAGQSAPSISAARIAMRELDTGQRIDVLVSSCQSTSGIRPGASMPNWSTFSPRSDAAWRRSRRACRSPPAGAIASAGNVVVRQSLRLPTWSTSSRIAARITSSMSFTQMNVISLATFAGSFSKSRRFCDGGNHPPDAAAVRGQGLVLEAANGQDAAAQGDLPGHGRIAPHGPPGERRDEGGGHRDAGRRAVLRLGALRQVDMQIEPLAEIRDRSGAGACASGRRRARPGPIPA